ncbi:MAG: hypothetical protein ABI197_06865 [Granulicella sp.]
MVKADKAGKAIPSSVVKRIVGGRDLWIVPHNEAPFSTLRLGVLPTTPDPFFFSDSIREHFEEAHARIMAGGIYDVWGCPQKS